MIWGAIFTIFARENRGIAPKVIPAEYRNPVYRKTGIYAIPRAPARIRRSRCKWMSFETDEGILLILGHFREVRGEIVSVSV